MKEKKGKYPSQIKYELNNPTITARMKLYEKVKILEMAKEAGKNISDLIRMALLNLEKDFSTAITKAEEDGKQKGMNEWAIWCFCRKCSKAGFIVPNSKVHLKILEIMKDSFEHIECPIYKR